MSIITTAIAALFISAVMTFSYAIMKLFYTWRPYSTTVDQSELKLLLLVATAAATATATSTYLMRRLRTYTEERRK